MSSEASESKKPNLEVLGQIFIATVASLGIIAAVVMGVITMFSSANADKGNQSHTTQQNW
jgi:flagellar basal body-associated protein FliL